MPFISRQCPTLVSSFIFSDQFKALFVCAHTPVRDGRSRIRPPNGSRRHPSQMRRLRSLTFPQGRLEKRPKGCDLEIASVFPLPAPPTRPVRAHDAGFPPRRRLALPTRPPSFIPSGQIRRRLSSLLSPPSSPPSGPAACAGLPPDRQPAVPPRSPPLNGRQRRGPLWTGRRLPLARSAGGRPDLLSTTGSPPLPNYFDG